MDIRNFFAKKTEPVISPNEDIEHEFESQAVPLLESGNCAERVSLG